VVAPLLGAWLLLQNWVRRSLPLLATSSALLIAGVFVHRFLIMPAAYNAIPMSMTPFGMQDNHWSLPIASGRFFPGMSTFINDYSYMPSLVEVVILLGIMAYAVFLVLLAIDKLPILIKERI
jgi:dimethyl sulfoxide reductase membrane subunit